MKRNREPSEASQEHTEDTSVIVIRNLKQEDLNSVHRLLTYWLVDFQVSCGKKPYPEDVKPYSECIQNSFHQEDMSRFFVADMYGEVVGLLGYTREVDPLLREYIDAEDTVQYRFFLCRSETS
jgi:hypothetical protein